MAEIELYGFVYVFEDDMKLMDLLDANADEVREKNSASSKDENRKWGDNL